MQGLSTIMLLIHLLQKEYDHILESKSYITIDQTYGNFLRGPFTFERDDFLRPCFVDWVNEKNVR